MQTTRFHTQANEQGTKALVFQQMQRTAQLHQHLQTTFVFDLWEHSNQPKCTP